MSEKHPYSLNIGERLTLLNILPPMGDITTIKIIRKLRETLSPDEKENEEYGFVHEYICTQKDTDKEERLTRCDYKTNAATAPKCPFHDAYMQPTGMVFWKSEMSKVEKEIFLGNKSRDIIVEALKRLSEEKKLQVEHESLYIKFVDSAKPDEEE